MSAHKTILTAILDARGLLTYHVQTKQGRDPEKTIEDLRQTLEATSVSEAINQVRDGRR